MQDFKKIEEEMLEFWDKNKIQEKVKKKNEKGKKYYFLQGPPYTSGKIHIGHAWNNSLKDIAMRYKRMNGFNVWDRAGYDMHGLPTENAVQKKLGLKTKEDIEKYGLKKFIKECFEFSITHADLMNKDFKRYGIWMDFKDPYMPIKKEYVSGQWKFFKAANDQERLYKGSKVMHWDSETETALAKHELEYKEIKDKSVFLKFKKKNTKNEYFVIWTTTPWTIPFNLAIMANPDVDYVKIKVEEEYWILAKVLVGVFMNSIVEKKFEIVEEFKGKDLEGAEYEHFLSKEMPIYKEYKKKYPNTHTIILSKQFVDTTSGSGLVHCAPGCGPEDEIVAREYGIEGYNSLDERGYFKEEAFKKLRAKQDDRIFIKIFEEKKHLIATTEIVHEYPHSWRSHKPVVFRTTEQWFLKTTDLIPRLVKMNKNVNWTPKKSGESYERWAENLKDNSVTRQRFWGCPVPIWVNEKDSEDYIVIGSCQELEELTNKKFTDQTIHKPWIDSVIIEKDGKKYKRVPDVCDVWLDSGVASWNCLYNDPKLIKEYFPADFVLEGAEQTRLWFSLLQICSSIVFNKSCFKNAYVHGMILDIKGVKMSKSLGNIISPYEVVDKYSSDIFRYYMCQIPTGENVNFNWEEVKQKQRNMIVLFNVGNYLNEALKQAKRVEVNVEESDLEEKYILSRLNSTIVKVTELFENYDLDKTISEIEKLFLDLSRIYIKMTRDKITIKKELVTNTIYSVYVNILKMFSTITPLVSEYLWKNLKENVELEESVHLTSWPMPNKKLINKDLEKEFESALELIEKGLAKRDQEQIGLKWPLSKAKFKANQKFPIGLQEIIRNQLNVKKVEFVSSKEISVELDTKLTKELEAEGYGREISRKVQAARKKSGFIKTDTIKLALGINQEFQEMIKPEIENIILRTNSSELIIENIEETEYQNAFDEKIKGKKIRILFNKN